MRVSEKLVLCTLTATSGAGESNKKKELRVLREASTVVSTLMATPDQLTVFKHSDR